MTDTDWQWLQAGPSRIGLAPDLDPAIWRDWLLAIAARPPAEHGGTALQTGRNIVSRHHLAEQDLALKDFGIRRDQALIYAVRATKARRAVMAAWRLAAIGLQTPAPLALLEQRRLGLLTRALLVNRYQAGCQTLRTCINEHVHAPALFLPAIGRSVRRLHDQRLWHADLTAANILIDDADPAQHWYIDINRLRERALSEEARWQNIGKLSLPDELWPSLLAGYMPEADDQRRRAVGARLIHHHQIFRERGLRKRQRKLAKRGETAS